ncbi:YbaN family protein [Stygiobacter electus]|uniref:YbaN family protein n=1 Tax=Stygiobacter electus TaxID=3032292 RepID=A0AAE3P1Z6_9BACT|nr:YbaN family protein [Stygiobacter electus]MDF1611350.1 YbaN family protein [Stygiobacter electus]
MSTYKQKIFLILGFIFVAFGIIGAILPLMPSTVFFILAAYFFSKSSEKFHKKLLDNKYIGRHIKNFYEKRGMPLRVKIISILSLFLTITISIILVKRTPFLVVILLSVAFAVSFYIISLNTIENSISKGE